MTAGASDNHDEQRQHYGITFAVLAISGASYALLQSAVGPALPDIQKELHASATATAWLLSASGLPSESGFTLAFAAGACLLAALAGLIVPKGPSRSRTAAMAMASD